MVRKNNNTDCSKMVRVKIVIKQKSLAVFRTTSSRRMKDSYIIKIITGESEERRINKNPAHLGTAGRRCKGGRRM